MEESKSESLDGNSEEDENDIEMNLQENRIVLNDSRFDDLEALPSKATQKPVIRVTASENKHLLRSDTTVSLARGGQGAPGKTPQSHGPAENSRSLLQPQKVGKQPKNHSLGAQSLNLTAETQETIGTLALKTQSQASEYQAEQRPSILHQQQERAKSYLSKIFGISTGLGTS